MFLNSFQNCPSFEIFDAQVGKDKDPNYAILFQATAPNNMNKIYDKNMKGYIIELDGANNQLRFPKDQKVDLCLIQQYLVFQIFVPLGMQWNLEIVITDSSKTKRRINFIPAFHKIQQQFFHVKVPNDMIKHGQWLNLSIDTHSFMDAWKGQTFRTIDSFTISSTVKIRKIFTMKAPLFEINSEDQTFQSKPSNPLCQDVPKNFSFPAGLSFSNIVISLSTVESLYGSEKEPGQLPSQIHGHGHPADLYVNAHSKEISKTQTQPLKSRRDVCSPTQEMGKKSAPHNQTEQPNSQLESSLEKQPSNQVHHQNYYIEEEKYSSSRSAPKSKMMKQTGPFRGQKSPGETPTNPEMRGFNKTGENPSAQSFMSTSSNKTSSTAATGKNLYGLKSPLVNSPPKIATSQLDQVNQSNLTASVSTRTGSRISKQQSPLTKVSSVLASSKERQEPSNLVIKGQSSSASSNQHPVGTRVGIQDNQMGNQPNPWSGIEQITKQNSADSEEEEDTNNYINNQGIKKQPDEFNISFEENQKNDTKQHIISQPNNFKQLRNYQEELQIRNNYEDDYEEESKLNFEEQPVEEKQRTTQIESQSSKEATKQLQQAVAQKEETPKIRDTQEKNNSTSKLDENKNKNQFGKKQLPTHKEGQENQLKAPVREVPNNGRSKLPSGKTQNINQGTGNETDFNYLSQKFNTISDPRAFRKEMGIIEGQIPNASSTSKKRNGFQDQEIEENIEIQYQNSISEPSTFGVKQSQNGVMCQSSLPDAESQELGNKQEDPNNEDLEDSLEFPQNQKSDFLKKTFNNTNQNLDQALPLNKNEGENFQNSRDVNRDGFYQTQLNQFIANPSLRPFTPPFQSVVQLQSSSLITKKNQETVVIEPENQFTTHDQDDGSQNEILEVIYDPVLNCYYDPQTKAYYELQDE